MPRGQATCLDLRCSKLHSWGYLLLIFVSIYQGAILGTFVQPQPYLFKENSPLRSTTWLPSPPATRFGGPHRGEDRAAAQQRGAALGPLHGAAKARESVVASSRIHRSGDRAVSGGMECSRVFFRGLGMNRLGMSEYREP